MSGKKKEFNQGKTEFSRLKKENIKDFYDEEINKELEQILHKNQNTKENTLNKNYIVNGKYLNRRILNQNRSSVFLIN